MLIACAYGCDILKNRLFISMSPPSNGAPYHYLNKILSNINIDFCLHMVFNTNTNTKLKERFKDG